ADDEILLADQDGRDDARKLGRIVAAIAIDEGDDAARDRRRPRARKARRPIAGTRLDQDGCASFSGTRDGVVATATVDHDYSVEHVSGNRADNRTDRCTLVEDRDDERNARYRPRRHALKAPAQPAIGASAGRRIGQERRAELAVSRTVPDLAQRLLGGVAQ